MVKTKSYKRMRDRIERLLLQGYPLCDILSVHEDAFYMDAFWFRGCPELREIVACMNIYNWVKECIQRDLLIFPEKTTEDFLFDLSEIYVLGYGDVSLDDMSLKPQLTGSMLNIKAWDLGESCEGITRSSADIMSAINLVAEIEARAKDIPYDVVCMQLNEYNTMLKSTNMESMSNCRRYLYDLEERMQDYCAVGANNHTGMENFNHYGSKWNPDTELRFFISDDIMEEVYMPERIMQFADRMHGVPLTYVACKHYYLSMFDIYELRCRSGDKILENPIC